MTSFRISWKFSANLNTVCVIIYAVLFEKQKTNFTRWYSRN